MAQQNLKKEALYLIRRNLRVISGPMNLIEISQGFQKMEIGLFDEICGNCGPWVQLAHTEKLRQVYPQVATNIISRMPLADALQLQKNKKVENVKIRFETIKNKKRPSQKTFIGISVASLALIAFIFARLLSSNNSNRIPAVSAQPKITNYYDIECSKPVFETKWSEAQLGGRVFSSGLFTPKNSLLKILFWDPYWIVRHAQMPSSQLPPKSFFEGCLLTMKSTLGNLSLNSKEQDFLKIVLERIKSQLNIIRGMPATTANLEWTHSLQVLNCFDSANSAGEFERCRQIQRKMDPDYQKILEDYEKYQLLRVGISEARPDETLMMDLKQNLAEFPVDGSLGRLDYRADLKLLK